MAYRIQQILLRSAMGIMTGDARFRPRPDPLMGAAKICGILFVALEENISKGKATSEEAVNEWLSSEEARAVIENSVWTHSGVGTCLFGGYRTQMFKK